MATSARTPVAIIGAGPAGLLLAHLLHLQGIDSVVVERRTRAHLESRIRAGMLEAPTVALLREVGLAGRLDREALAHNGFYLRFDGATHNLEFALVAGASAVNYGQHELVRDLVAARLETGRPLHFAVDDVRLAGLDTTTPRVHWRSEGREHEVVADVVAGCDGVHGISRTAIPAGAVTVTERSYPFAWLGVLAETRPAMSKAMYCAHPDGFSLHSLRGPHRTRQYLQVPAMDRLDDWPDQRIWAQLRHRSEDPALESGPVLERLLTRLRSQVVSPMRFGRLFLAGDAAHVVPPTGAKGLNMAVADVCALSRAVGAYCAGAGTDLLDAYSATCLPRVWQAQRVSTSLTTLLHRMSDDPFDLAVQRARLHRLVSSPAAAAALAEPYLGLPFPAHWRWAG